MSFINLKKDTCTLYYITIKSIIHLSWLQTYFHNTVWLGMTIETKIEKLETKHSRCRAPQFVADTSSVHFPVLQLFPHVVCLLPAVLPAWCASLPGSELPPSIPKTKKPQSVCIESIPKSISSNLITDLQIQVYLQSVIILSFSVNSNLIIPILAETNLSQQAVSWFYQHLQK